MLNAGMLFAVENAAAGQKPRAARNRRCFNNMLDQTPRTFPTVRVTHPFVPYQTTGMYLHTCKFLMWEFHKIPTSRNQASTN